MREFKDCLNCKHYLTSDSEIDCDDCNDLSLWESEDTPTTGMMTAEEYMVSRGYPSYADKHMLFSWMTDYANYVSEIQAVRFAEWVHENYYQSRVGWHKNCDPATKETAMTTEQLYKKWKENSQ